MYMYYFCDLYCKHCLITSVSLTTLLWHDNKLGEPTGNLVKMVVPPSMVSSFEPCRLLAARRVLDVWLVCSKRVYATSVKMRFILLFMSIKRPPAQVG